VPDTGIAEREAAMISVTPGVTPALTRIADARVSRALTKYFNLLPGKWSINDALTHRHRL
jgi:hypothetical protein